MLCRYDRVGRYYRYAGPHRSGDYYYHGPAYAAALREAATRAGKDSVFIARREEEEMIANGQTVWPSILVIMDLGVGE